MNSNSKVSLVIFVCEGREHLLINTITSFKKYCNYKFDKTILAIDGKINHTYLNGVEIDCIVQSYERKGYINNIINALKLIDTEYFFWLEDDWSFNLSIDLTQSVNCLDRNINWTQIRLSKTGPLTIDEKSNHLLDSMYESKQGFSANPNISRTILIKQGFNALISLPKDLNTKYVGFENFLTDFFSKEKLTNVVIDPKTNYPIEHSGYLESTPREFHMINSIDENLTDANKEYITGLGSGVKITYLNKIKMLFKLSLYFVILIPKIFLKRKAYDTAFRIVETIKAF